MPWSVRKGVCELQDCRLPLDCDVLHQLQQLEHLQSPKHYDSNHICLPHQSGPGASHNPTMPSALLVPRLRSPLLSYLSFLVLVCGKDSSKLAHSLVGPINFSFLSHNPSPMSVALTSFHDFRSQPASHSNGGGGCPTKCFGSLTSLCRTVSFYVAHLLPTILGTRPPYSQLASLWRPADNPLLVSVKGWQLLSFQPKRI